MRRPNTSDFPAYYSRYIAKADTDDILDFLQVGKEKMLNFLKSIPMDKWEFRYEEGKWSIKELIIHLIDSERIFAYRALRISRGDKTPMPGFEENDYVPNSNADARSVNSILEEYSAVRQTSLALFYNFNSDMWACKGIASGSEFSTLSIAYIMAGHEQHHVGVLEERYLD